MAPRLRTTLFDVPPAASAADEQLQQAFALEKEILAANAIRRAVPVLREALAPYIGKPLDSYTCEEMRRVLELCVAKLDLPTSTKLLIRQFPDRPYTIDLELQDE